MAVIDLLSERAPRTRLERIEASIEDSHPYGIDVQLTLYVCYELHHRGFAGVDPGWEWNPGLLHLRARLEEAFLSALRHDVGALETTADHEMWRLSMEPGDERGPTEYLRTERYLRTEGTWQQMREHFVHRSLYHLKEGDPHAWAIPRLTGQAKAAFAAVEAEGFGAGRGDGLHQTSYADLMAAADLDAGYLAYIDVVPAEALAVVNLMSLFGLHRRLRGAAVGHVAATEITAPSGARRMIEALDRLNAPEPCREFYREHVAADAMHEQMVRADVIGDVIAREPSLEGDVVFGMRAMGVVENRLNARIMRHWLSGESSLRRPLA